VLARLALELCFTPDHERGVRLAGDAVGMARRLGDDETLAHTLVSLHAMWQEPAHVEARLALAHEMRELARRRGDRELHVWSLGMRVQDHFELGDVPAAEADLAALERELHHLRAMPQRTWLQYYAARAIAAGRLDEGERLAEQALAAWQAAGFPDGLAVYGAQLYQLRWMQDRLDEIEPVVAAGVAEYPHVLAWRLAMAQVHVLAGRRVEARREFELCAVGFESLTFDYTWSTAMTTAADVCADLGDAERAGELYRLIAPFAHRPAVLGPVVTFGGCLARPLGRLASLLGRWADSEAHFGLAVEMDTRMEAPPFVAMAQRDHAHMLLTRGGPGDRERADALLASARATAEELGLPRLARETAELAAR
jgi:hypothetical protein